MVWVCKGCGQCQGSGHAIGTGKPKYSCLCPVALAWLIGLALLIGPAIVKVLATPIIWLLNAPGFHKAFSRLFSAGASRKKRQDYKALQEVKFIPPFAVR